MLRLAAAFFLAALSLAPLAAQDDAPPPVLGILMQTLGKSDDPATQLNLLRGISAGIKGRRGLQAPAEWAAIAEKLGKSESAEVRELVQAIGGVFGSRDAMAAMRAALADEKVDAAARGKALEQLVSAKDEETLPLLRKLIAAPGPLRAPALRGLAAFSDPQIVHQVMSTYATLTADEKRDALGTLAARAEWARNFTWLFDGQQFPKSDVSPALIRQLRGYKDQAIDDALDRHFGKMAAGGSAARQEEVAKFKTWLTPEFLRRGDINRGRALFSQTCATCHKLFGEGGDIGPELTGSNRSDLDYLLQNIVDPNALIGDDYRNHTIALKDGRVVMGLVRGEDANTLTVKTLGEQIVVPKPDIKERVVSEVSMMPEGQLAAMAPSDARDLLAYLGSPRQAPLALIATNGADFFNGSDLAKWQQRGVEKAWRVEAGEIIGRGAKDTAALVNPMVVRDYKLTAKLKATGEKAVAEFAFRGHADLGEFLGASLSLGGAAPPSGWLYFGKNAQPIPAPDGFAAGEWIEVEVEARGAAVQIKLNGKLAYNFTRLPFESRSQIGFYLRGEGCELQVRDLKIEAL